MRLVLESQSILSIILRIAQSTNSLVNNQEDYLAKMVFSISSIELSGQEKILADTKEFTRNASDRDVDYIKLIRKRSSI